MNLRKLLTDVNEALVGFVILKLPCVCVGRPDNIPAKHGRQTTRRKITKQALIHGNPSICGT